MQRLMSALCALMFSAGLFVAGALPAAAQAVLQGNWIATKAETNGSASPDVVGHRLSVSGNHFEIKSKDGKPLFAGIVRVAAHAKPARVDFLHGTGAPRGKRWKGIYMLDGDTLTIADNAADLKKARPKAFESKAGSGCVLVTFVRVK